jgi:putative peptidoglycan lipid II flippase
MSTPPPRAGQTAADLTGRRAGRDQAAQGRYGTARHAAAGPAQRRHGRVNPEETSVVRSSGVMALGTLASRGTGFLRTLVLAYVLGVSAGVSAAYNNANTLPNAVYDLMLGGILTSVVVPLLVNAAKRDADGGEAYDQRMFTLTTVALAVLTLAATLAAGLLVDLYAHDLTPPASELTP